MLGSGKEAASQEGDFALMNRKLKLLAIPLIGIGLAAGTAVPVLARAHQPARSAAVVQQVDGNGQGHKGDPAIQSSSKDVIKGTVQSVSGNVITLASGKQITVDANTKYTSPGDKDNTLADVVPGVAILAQVKETDSGALAVAVHILGQANANNGYNGVVTTYTPGSSITIVDGQGTLTTFAINANTKVNFPAGVTAIQAGDAVTVTGTRDSSGTLTANVINVHRVRVIEGTVTALAAGSITIQPSDGSPVIASVDANTIYAIKGKASVAVGDTVKVVATTQSDGSLLAKAVLEGVNVPSLFKGPGMEHQNQNEHQHRLGPNKHSATTTNTTTTTEQE